MVHARESHRQLRNWVVFGAGWRQPCRIEAVQWWKKSSRQCNLRDHLLGEMRWVRYLQNMKCMRFDPTNNRVYIHACSDDAWSQFLKLTEWPYSQNKPKDVSSSCLDQKSPECPTCSNSSHQNCPECPTCSNSSHSDCRCPECVEFPDILRNLVWLTLPGPSHTWFMVPVLLVFCGALGWIRIGSKLDGPTGLKQQEKKLDAMEATILHIESTLTEIAAAIDGQRGSDGSDSSSNCTVGSWTHVTSGQPCCFLQDTYFKVVTDDGQIFCPAKMLFKGSRVIAADGTVVEVLYPPEQHQVDAVIKLQVGSASLVVSPDHRILIPGNKTIQAKDLEVGSEVLLDGTEAKLTNFEWNQVPTMVMKIAFKPDIPVAAFMCAPSILSKGSRNKPRVRRGTSSRTPDGGDALTVPDTEPPLTP